MKGNHCELTQVTKSWVVGPIHFKIATYVFYNLALGLISLSAWQLPHAAPLSVCCVCDDQA